MTLHLGGDVTIPMKDIIAILDIESSEDSDINGEFLEIARDEGFVKRISEDPPKTFILAELKGKPIVFLSPISSATLYKRADYMGGIPLSDSKREQGGYDGKKRNK